MHRGGMDREPGTKFADLTLAAWARRGRKEDHDASLGEGSRRGCIIGRHGRFAAAQTAVIDLSPDQRTTVYRSMTRERVRVAPPTDFRARVGVEVPSSVELYPVPETVEVPAIRRYRYTVIDDQVVLVDPGTHRVVEIIGE